MAHLRTKRKPNSKNLGKLISSVFLVFVLMLIVFSLGYKFKAGGMDVNQIARELNLPSLESPMWVLRGDGVLYTNQGDQIFVEIASTTESREQGLSGTEKLKVHKDAKITLTEGMLFVFPVSSEYQFWMKDMNYDLDILWLDENYKIVHIEKNARANSYQATNPSSSEIFTNGDAMAKYVLEINAGLSDRLNLNIGDKLNMQ